jgi:hypothetical protein
LRGKARALLRHRACDESLKRVLYKFLRVSAC